MEQRQTFGKFIKEKRLEKGYSQQQLAEILFVTESAISKWERGVNYPDITTISGLCKALDISEHELITASNDDEYRQIKKDAKTYRKISKATFWVPTVLYSAALVICFICNLAVNRTLSWFWVVLGSLICAFSFFPGFSRFFSKNKFFYFLATTLASVALLLVICGIFAGSVAWVPVAISGTLTGYVLFFMPVLFKKINLPPIVDKTKYIIYVLSLICLTVLILLSATILTPFPLTEAILITLYGFAPFLLLSIISSFGLGKYITGSLGVLFIGLTVYGTNFVLNRLLGSNGQYSYKINFADWANCTNGNVSLIILIVSALLFIGLTAYGIVKKKDE